MQERAAEQITLSARLTVVSLGVGSPGFGCCLYSFLGLGVQGAWEGRREEEEGRERRQRRGGSGLYTEHGVHRPRRASPCLTFSIWELRQQRHSASESFVHRGNGL